MRSSIIIWYYVWLVIACQFTFSYGGSCNFVGDATDSSQLNRLDSIKDKTFTAELTDNGDKLTFHYQLCSNPTTTGSSCKDLNNASAVEVSGNDCVVIGNYNETHIKSGATWISLAYKGTSIVEMPNVSRSTVVTFFCDPDAKETVFNLADITRCQNHRLHYTFILTSPNICIKGGLSAGSVICIIFFTIVGAYLLLGFTYKRLVLRAKGFEQIPNYESWRELGSLVADGCDYLCRCNNRQSSKLYQGIDDSFSHPNENSGEPGGDDHLLPM
ncbi:mannose-6-phosphate receptor, cation dependent [Chamberlinius hualienensis]